METKIVLQRIRPEGPRVTGEKGLTEQLVHTIITSGKSQDRSGDLRILIAYTSSSLKTSVQGKLKVYSLF